MEQRIIPLAPCLNASLGGREGGWKRNLANSCKRQRGGGGGKAALTHSSKAYRRSTHLQGHLRLSFFPPINPNSFPSSHDTRQKGTAQDSRHPRASKPGQLKREAPPSAADRKPLSPVGHRGTCTALLRGPQALQAHRSQSCNSSPQQHRSTQRKSCRQSQRVAVPSLTPLRPCCRRPSRHNRTTVTPTSPPGLHISQRRGLAVPRGCANPGWRLAAPAKGNKDLFGHGLSYLNDDARLPPWAKLRSSVSAPGGRLDKGQRPGGGLW